MRPFYEDSSAAKTLTPDRKIHRALKNMSPSFDWFVVYLDGQPAGRFEKREAARVRKAFLELETGKSVVIKGEYDNFFYLRDEDLRNYYDSDVQLTYSLLKSRTDG